MKILFFISMLALSLINQNPVEAMIGLGQTKTDSSLKKPVLSTNSDPLTKPVETWKNLPVLTENELRIYNKTWNPKATLNSNIENLADMFLDICCDFSFKISRKEASFVYGKSQSNSNIIFAESILSIHDLIKKDLHKYYLTNFITNSGNPREFTEQMKEDIRNYIRFISKDSVGCKLLRIAISKTSANHLPKLIFIPITKSAQTSPLFGINFSNGVYGWQVERDNFSRCFQESFRGNIEASNMFGLFPEQKYSEINLPIYRYMLFTPEILFNGSTIIAAKNTMNRFEFFNIQLPADVSLFNRIIKSLHPNKIKTRKLIKARLDIKNKKFSQKLNSKLLSILKLHIESTCFIDNLSPQIHQQIVKLGGIKNYANLAVESMPKDQQLEQIENLLSSYYKNDEEYRFQYGITENGLDSLNECSYTSHRYHWIRTSRANSFNCYNELYEIFIKEVGDFNLYSYYLSKKSPIKYPKFGVNQYKCSDLPSTSTKVFTEPENPKTSKFKMPLYSTQESRLPPPYPEIKNQRKFGYIPN